MKHTKYTSHALTLLLWGIILGFTFGLIKTILNLINNNYMHYQLYNLVLFNFQGNFNKYSAIFVIMALSLFLLYLIIKLVLILAFQKFYILKSINTVVYSLKFSLILSSILFVVGYLYYYEIAFGIEGFSSFLKNILVPISKKTYLFHALLFLFLTGILTISLTLILSQLNLAELAQLRFSKIVNSKIIRICGLGGIGFFVLFNIFTIGYQTINSAEGPNVIIISLDTVRADHLGSYGYLRDTMPNVDKLAKQGVLFENAFSQAPWTLPTMASIHTSLYPSEHGALTVYSKLNENFVTIAEYLYNNFYKTIGVISQPFVSSQHGFAQGFEIFDEHYISGGQ